MDKTDGLNGRVNMDKPIYTPPPEEGPHWMDPEADRLHNHGLYGKAGYYLKGIFKAPVRWFKENVVDPNRGEKYYWFHRKFGRAVPIDECYIDDYACINEADLEFRRFREVDRQTLNILRHRKDECYLYFKGDRGFDYSFSDKCKELSDTYDREELNFFIKYGEMGYASNIRDAYTKQKHRMIMERRRELKKQQSEDYE